MARYIWVVKGPVFFMENYVPRTMDSTVKAGTKVTVEKVHHGFFGPFWSGAVALTVKLPSGRILPAVPIKYLRR
jgi:hypothetical protein